MYPIDEPLTAKDIEHLQELGVTAELLREFPVDGPFSLANVLELSQFDVPGVLSVMRSAPVDGPFDPEQAIEVARGGTYPEGIFNDDEPISVEEFISRLQ